MHQPLIRQSHQIHLAFKLQQALAILQMPQLELGKWIEEEIEKNPLLSEKKPLKPKQKIPDSPATLSFYELMETQIRENFGSEEERKAAKFLVESLDEKGFLSAPLEEIQKTAPFSLDFLAKVLQTLQTFHPPGIFARNLQECLLLQLKAQGNENKATFELVEHHFSDFLHGRYRKIAQEIREIDIAEAIHKLTLLQTRPIRAIEEEIISPVIPDILIEKTAKGWKISIGEEFIPHFQIDPQYDALSPHSPEEKETLRLWRLQGKWLLRALKTRKEILLKMTLFIVSRQSAYLDQRGSLEELTIQDIAKHLDLHPSTVSRALTDKYASSPRGLILLKNLVNGKPQRAQAKDFLQELIAKEDKTRPLTDEQIVQILKEKGVSIARRTVVKYRSACKIPPAATRKALYLIPHKGEGEGALSECPPIFLKGR